MLRLSSSAPVFIAQDKGYFREAGLDVELKFFGRGAADCGRNHVHDADFWRHRPFAGSRIILAGVGTLAADRRTSQKAGDPRSAGFASTTLGWWSKTPRISRRNACGDRSVSFLRCSAQSAR